MNKVILSRLTKNKYGKNWKEGENLKAYFEGDKNILVFKPIQRSKKGRKKKKINEERLKECGTKELAHELALIAEWDRREVRKAKQGPGLDNFMERWLRQPAKEEKDE